MPFVIGTLMAPGQARDHTLRVGVFGLIMPDLDAMFGHRGLRRLRHDRDGHPRHQRQAGRAAARPGRWATSRPGYEFAVVDKDTGELCAEGETGELWLRGTRGIQLFLEYFDNPEANAKAFEDGWFKTGDMVMLGEGGNVFYKERDKDLLKVGGENVSAREVEDVDHRHARRRARSRSSASSTSSSTRWWSPS